MGEREGRKRVFFRFLVGVVLAFALFQVLIFSHTAVLGGRRWEELRGLKREVANMEAERDGLLELLFYVRSDEYQERVLREELLMGRQGDQALAVIVGEGGEGEPGEGLREGRFVEVKEPWREWWDLFFSPWP